MQIMSDGINKSDNKENLFLSQIINLHDKTCVVRDPM